MSENTAPGAEFPLISCSMIGKLQLNVVLVFFTINTIQQIETVNTWPEFIRNVLHFL